MAKNLFAGLVKITGNNWAAYEEAQTTGKLIFADLDTNDASAGKYIWANGVEYRIADSTDLDELIQRVTVLEGDVLDLSTNVIPGLDSRIEDLEDWKVTVDASQLAQDASIEDHEGRIEDLENAAKDHLVDAQIAAAVNAGVATVTLTTEDASGDVATTSFTVEGDDYVKVTGTNSITLEAVVATTSAEIEDATVADASLTTAYAVQQYVASKISGIEGALVYRGTVDSEAALLALDPSVGDVYVASQDWVGETYSADQGDMFIWNGTTWNRVERNLDQAVQATSSASFATGSVMIGGGAHLVEASTISIADVSEAIDKSRTAVQTATASGDDYVNAEAVVTGTEVTVNVSANVVDVSTAATKGEGLADAKDVKDYVDSKVGDVEVTSTISTETPDYVVVGSTVSNGRDIDTSVSVVVATLADASEGGADFKALADARDVYERLTEVEEVMSSANTAMAESIGLADDYTPGWSAGSGINDNSTYREVIEELHSQVGGNVVNSIGGEHGDIELDNASYGNVEFTMEEGQDGSILTGYVDLSDIEASIGLLEDRIADVSQHAIDNDASIVALKAKDVEIDSSIDRLDASVSALENADYVHTLTGEGQTLTNANDAYVNVDVTDDGNGNLTLDASVEVATKVWDSSVVPATATGLATDAYVNNYVQEALLWEVIG